jgi:serine phosphatase RsbU (regulator of sigma subunit)
MIGDMRQGLALVRGALIATALVAVPVGGPVAAHALTVPGQSVDAGPVHVQTPPVNVPTPSVPPVSVPHVPIPGPAGGAVNGGIDRANGVVNQGGNAVNNALSPGGGGSGNSGNGTAPGSSNSGAGNGPRASGGGQTGRRKARAKARRRAATRARTVARQRRVAARARRIANRARAGGPVAVTAVPVAKTSKPGTPGSKNPIAAAISSIEQVIPGPVLALIGILALLAALFALRSAIVGRRARRLERQKEELLGDVGLLQRALLPDVPTDLRGIDVSVAYRPAEGPAAGGDFYDVFELDDDRTAIIVGDVCGHGRQALAVTALMRYTLRAYLGAGFEPRIALQVSGRTIEGAPDSELTTVVLAIYDARAGTLTYACAGHEPPIVLGAAAHEPVTVSSAPPLGGFMSTGHRQTTVPLPPGAAACFFTDGLVEARLGEQMMGRERLTELVTELAPDEGAQLLLQRLAAAADRAPDDMAACLVRARGDAVESRMVRIEELESDADDLKEGDRVLQFLIACGIPEASAQETLEAAQAKGSEFGGALLRVHASGKGGRVEILPTQVAALPVPSLAADARRRATLQIPA